MASPKGIQEIKFSFTNLHIRMKWVYNMVDTNFNSKRNITNDVRYISNQLDCHASRIADNTRDLHDLMEKVDYLKEDVQKLTRMMKGSHC